MEGPAARSGRGHGIQKKVVGISGGLIGLTYSLTSKPKPKEGEFPFEVGSGAEKSFVYIGLRPSRVLGCGSVVLAPP